MKTSDLVFPGMKRSVVALNRATGEQVWVTNLIGADFVNLVLQDETLFASAYGEVFCLDPLTGQVRWHNKLEGFGTGLVTIALESNYGSGNLSVLAAKRRRDEAAAAVATNATV